MGKSHQKRLQPFRFPKEIRKMIDTTNAIESYNSQLRKVLKGKEAFPNETAVMKWLCFKQMLTTKILDLNNTNEPMYVYNPY